MMNFLATVVLSLSLICGGAANTNLPTIDPPTETPTASAKNNDPMDRPMPMAKPETEIEKPVLLNEDGKWRCQHGDIMTEADSQAYLEKNVQYYYEVIWINYSRNNLTDDMKATIDQSVKWLKDNMSDRISATDMLNFGCTSWIKKQIEAIEEADRVAAEDKLKKADKTPYWNPSTNNEAKPESSDPMDASNCWWYNDVYFDQYGIGHSDTGSTAHYWVSPSGKVYEITDPNFHMDSISQSPTWSTTGRYVGEASRTHR